jgi:hypothetical protein
LDVYRHHLKNIIYYKSIHKFHGKWYWKYCPFAHLEFLSFKFRCYHNSNAGVEPLNHGHFIVLIRYARRLLLAVAALHNIYMLFTIAETFTWPQMQDISQILPSQRYTGIRETSLKTIRFVVRMIAMTRQGNRALQSISTLTLMASRAAMYYFNWCYSQLFLRSSM